MNLEQAEQFRLARRAIGDTSDGCTLAPEVGTPCCEMHDYLRRHRPDNINARDADRLFRECLQKKGHPVLAWVYWAAVRMAHILGVFA